MPQKADDSAYTFIDLFAGAGGLSEGFIQAGFTPVAHIENNKYAAMTLETRAAYYYLKSSGKLDIYYDYLRGNISREKLLENVPDEYLNGIICQTMSEASLPELYQLIDQLLEDRGIGQIDIIIGGPPCQVYSVVGRAQSSHMTTAIEDDPRNTLYKLYIDFLNKYQPKMFVFENVIGIKSANNGKTWEDIQEKMKAAGYKIECHEQNAKDFGVLQNRRRMIIIGWRQNSQMNYPEFEKISVNAVVNDILSDLPKLHPGESSGKYGTQKISNYLKETGIRTPEDVLTLHASRPNKERDIEIYKKAIELWNNDPPKRLNYNDLPENLKTHKNRDSFQDRFKVVEGNSHYCHTMLAHISKDGHYFIHPDIEQHRSITVREAARIQSFPDSYYFEGPRTAQFTQIGNAVPPLMARGIAEGIAAQLSQEKQDGRKSSA